MEADFSGYATRSGIRCSDGLTILAHAFKDNHQQTVPLVWQHDHNNPDNVLGHAVLENRDDGVYAYASFNESPKAQTAKESVRHGDITHLSIYANQLKKQGNFVKHGNIREVSLVLAGANPEAFIDSVTIRHGDGFEVLEDEAIIYSGLELEHDALDEDQDDELNVQEVLESLNEEQSAVFHSMLTEALSHASKEGATVADNEKTVKDVLDSMTDEQKNVMYYMIGEAVEDAGGDSEVKQSDADMDTLQHSITTQIQEGFLNMANVFEQEDNDLRGATLNHSQIKTIIADADKLGSFKESVLAHADEYGITDIELLFPDARTVGSTPELIARQADWVPKVLGATKHAPFAKIKSIVADLTAAEARAKGYVKGTMKKEEVIKLLKRTTGPTTVYKKQKLDRDDILDITDFDIIAWLKWEIRFMLNEELARAILIGDGRSSSNADKIKDPEGAIDGTGIRSILHDHETYAHQVELPANTDANGVIDAVTRARTHYRGSGSPTWYTTDKVVTDQLLLKDRMGRRLFGTESELAAALRVKEIVTVEVLEEVPDLLGILVNLTDYTVGSNKGGDVTFFSDFDIDFNQEKYLMETRVSGALTKPKSAIVVRRAQGSEATVTAPSFNGLTNTITIPVSAGLNYLIDDEVVTGDVEILEDTEVNAEAQSGYYIPSNTNTTWNYTFTE